MLLTIFALMLGTLIGRLRGGSWSGVNAARLRGKGFFLSGITATLVLNVLGPSQPMFWLIISFVSFIGFAISNLSLSGMMVMLIGIGLNLMPVLANGAVPVSERALQSVGVVDDGGSALIEGPRESTATATRLRFLGDVVPVPLANKVVSLGDLIALVAVADIAMNLLLRSRNRSLDDGGVTYVEAVARDTEETPSTSELAADIEPLDDDAEPVPTTRRHLRYFVSALPSGISPAHAAKVGPVTSYTDPADLPPPSGQPVTTMAAPSPNETSQPSTAIAGPLPAETGQPVTTIADPLRAEEEPSPPRRRPEPAKAGKSSPRKSPDDDAEVVLDLTDRRPIIDLTISPSDDQLAEFLRRRSEADVRLTEQAELASRPPRHRRGRSRARRREHGDLADSQN